MIIGSAAAAQEDGSGRGSSGPPSATPIQRVTIKEMILNILRELLHLQCHWQWSSAEPDDAAAGPGTLPAPLAVIVWNALTCLRMFVEFLPLDEFWKVLRLTSR